MGKHVKCPVELASDLSCPTAGLVTMDLAGGGEMVLYPVSAMERAMKIQEVVLRAISGEIRWFRAAEISGCRLEA